jgi:hypothetical protein
MICVRVWKEMIMAHLKDTIPPFNFSIANSTDEVQTGYWIHSKYESRALLLYQPTLLQVKLEKQVYCYVLVTTYRVQTDN